MMFNPLSSVLAFVQSKKLRALAMTDRRRSAVLPEVATMTGFRIFSPSGATNCSNKCFRHARTGFLNVRQV